MDDYVGGWIIGGWMNGRENIWMSRWIDGFVDG